ncbi:hypothetical protein DSCO28_21390 [Desulfosarcina ovata subsp. sediminis]|uniref:Uncharacterized protein n=1 Tax=Desulfosarcina ovata subsp. sediminis TaxID=885957 RepID=A0A5K7ZRG8_9BACT|nr:hypothetical protein DSCO28_21390 [Desulfosarcina ovata subsp. sediminis]
MHLINSSRFVHRLKNSQPDGITLFVEFIGKQAADKLLDDILSSEDFVAKLRHAPPGQVVRLMKYLGPFRAKCLLYKLATDDDYFEILLFKDRSGAGVAVLNFAGDEYIHKQIRLKIENSGYEPLLALSPQGVAKCLEYIGGDTVGDMADRVAKDERYFSLLCKSQPDDVAQLSLLLSSEIRAEVNTQLLHSEEFKEKLMTLRPAELLAFLNTIEQSEAKILLRKFIEEHNYISVLKSTPPTFVVYFLKKLDTDLRDRAIMHLLQKKSYMQVLMKSPLREIVNFLKYVNPITAREIINNLDNSETFYRQLKQTHGIQLAPYLEVVDELLFSSVESKAPSLMVLKKWWQPLKQSGPTGGFDFSSIGYLLPYILCRDANFLKEIIDWIYIYDVAFETWVQKTPIRRILRFRKGLQDANVNFRRDLWELMRERILDDKFRYR